MKKIDAMMWLGMNQNWVGFAVLAIDIFVVPMVNGIRKAIAEMYEQRQREREEFYKLFTKVPLDKTTDV